MMLAAAKDPDLIRLHCDEGGVEIAYDSQLFSFVSPDVFVNLDQFNPSKVFRVTRKLNIGISVDPALWNTENCFRYFTQGLLRGQIVDPFRSKALKKNPKCHIHGDEQTGLVASDELIALLTASGLDGQFGVNGDVYCYDSVGVAANEKYAGVDHREGNPCYNKSSHFEIKFKRISAAKSGAPAVEFLCLNVHLTANAGFDSESVITRLKTGLCLFREELGLKPRTYIDYMTQLQNAFEVTLENYRERGFGRYLHSTSQAALERYRLAKSYVPPSSMVMGAHMAPFFAPGGALADSAPKKTTTTVFTPGAPPKKFSAVAVAPPPLKQGKPAPRPAHSFLGSDNFPPLARAGAGAGAPRTLG